MNTGRVSTPAALAAAFAAAAIYVHFLIFAEFALLELAATASGGAAPGKLQLLPLVISGVLGGALAAAICRPARTAHVLASGLAVCAAAAALAALATGPALIVAATALTGLGLGIATVSLAGSAHRLFAGRGVGLWLGAATGVAYAICNVPALFESAPRTQAIAAALIAFAGAGCAMFVDASREPPPPPEARSSIGFWAGVAVLFLLVWFDSAAFYLIQHDTNLKFASWGGTGQLWTIAALHLIVAITAGKLIDAGWMRATLALAGVLLGAAVLALKNVPEASAVGHVLYPVAVSLYSVVLIAFPAFTRKTRTPASAQVRAAILFGIAGWIGSAAGIGMVLDLGRLALLPTAIAGVAMLLLLVWNRPWRMLAVIAVLVALPVREMRASQPDDPVAEGRRVYIAEGCIHCHSQFVRPGTRDELAWGPVAPLESMLAATPPLLGNRRQGPDLQNVGIRRSAEWNRLHLIEPRAVSPGSRMPSYAHLFAAGDARCDALLEYLASLGTGQREAREAQIANWRPCAPPSDAAHGRKLFMQHCAQCHGKDGRGSGPLAMRLTSPPRDLTAGAWRFISRETNILLAKPPPKTCHLIGDIAPAAPDVTLARVIKFGVPGTSMPGHETLPDADIGALTGHVRSLMMHAALNENPPG
ncbi:MAG TPA: cbb3-type cytochrome c oxidase subunit II [Opitutaceae bacterium]|nr:cbb3-type cytochrome c oxidase subunit II [Opitutaceae bacterium]